MLLGDMVAGFTKALGIQPCSPCEARRRALNDWHVGLMGQAAPPEQAPRVFVMDARDGQVVQSLRVR